VTVAKAAPDGYSLLVAEAGTFTINPTLYCKGKHLLTIPAFRDILNRRCVGVEGTEARV
jgi:hypothetical protein